MKIAVTGGTGFIGSRLLDRVSETGHRFRALTRRAMRPRRGVAWMDGALDQPDSLKALVQGCDAVIHIAGLLNGRTVAEFETVNVEGTKAIVTAAKDAGIRRFVHVSSLAARHPEISMYGASKARSEEIVQASGLDYTIVRPPAVYGPGDKETLDLFRMARLGIVLLPSAGRLSLIHVDDLVSLLLALCSGDAPSSLIVEPSDGADFSQREFARKLGSAVGRSNLALRVPGLVLRAGARIDEFVRGREAKLTRDRAAYFAHPDWTADPAKGIPHSLWRPSIPTDDGLAATARWYRDHGWI